MRSWCASTAANNLSADVLNTHRFSSEPLCLSFVSPCGVMEKNKNKKNQTNLNFSHPKKKVALFGVVGGKMKQERFLARRSYSAQSGLCMSAAWSEQGTRSILPSYNHPNFGVLFSVVVGVLLRGLCTGLRVDTYARPIATEEYKKKQEKRAVCYAML